MTALTITARRRRRSRRHRRAAAATLVLLALANACGDATTDSSSANVTTDPVDQPDASSAITASTIVPNDQAKPPPTTPTTTANTTTSTTSTTLASTTTVPQPVQVSTLLDPANNMRIGYNADPGTYLSDRLGVDIEITVDERLQYINFPGHVSFATFDATNRRPYGVFIHEVIGFVPQADMATPLERHTVPDEIDPFTGSFDDWFERDDRVVVTETGIDTVAGAPAPWWDIEVDAEAGDTFGCIFGDCVKFVVDPNLGPTNLGDDWRFRLWHLTAFEHATIIAFMESTDDRWDDTLAIARGLLEQLRIVEAP